MAEAQAKEQAFPCGKCGANLVFQVGAESLQCPYCGHANVIARGDAPIEEIDFNATLDQLAANETVQETIVVKCSGCGAESTMEPNVAAGDCAFCGTAIVSTGKSVKQIKPAALLPFKVKREEARQSFRDWLKTRWFAPNALKKIAKVQGRLQGIYVPYWTYDSQVWTNYTGQRGEYYYVNVSYTDSNGNRRTRRERRTRWYPASGQVHNKFDDVLVLASRSLPRKHAMALEPWGLSALVPYKDEYLSGFKAETYQVDLKEGFADAKTIMYPTIHQTICRDIGGDEQRVSSHDSRYYDISFKHILLPVWLSAYRYRDKVYRFLVNARTGEVQGERPYSWIKITLAVIAGLILIGIIAALSYVYGEGDGDWTILLNAL